MFCEIINFEKYPATKNIFGQYCRAKGLQLPTIFVPQWINCISCLRWVLSPLLRVTRVRSSGVMFMFMIESFTDQMETFSALLTLCEGIPFTKASDAELWCFFLLFAPKQTVEQTLETPSRSLWRHYIALEFYPQWALSFIGVSKYSHHGL